MFMKNGTLKVAQVFSITGKYLWLSRKKGCDVTSLKYGWASEILNHFKIDLEVSGPATNLDESYILLGNHVSYLDIPILIFCAPEVVFVSKKEVKSWPVIGSAAVKMKTIFVERENSVSRKKAKESIAKRLEEKNQKLIIFPSGTTSMGPSPRWQKGIFEIAEENKIKIRPFRIKYSPLRQAAYIGDDNLLAHMLNLFNIPRLSVSVEFHEVIDVHLSDMDKWKVWCEEF